MLKAQFTVRTHIAKEILSTEQSYLTSLQTFIKGFVERIKKAKMLTDQEFYSVFCNLEEITSLHVQFEADLNQRISNWSETSVLSDIFMKTDFFLRYQPYLQNYSASVLGIHFLTKKYPAFKAALKAFEDELLKTSMHNVESYFIMPVQRIPRYILLLKDLRKYCETNPEEAKKLDVAIDHVGNMLKMMNEKIDRDATDKVRKLIQVVDMVQGEVALLHPNRQYVSEGQLVVKKVGKKKLKFLGTKLYAFLFADLLVLCEPVKTAKTDDHPQFTFVQQIQLANITEVLTEKDRPTKEAVFSSHKIKSGKETQLWWIGAEEEVWHVLANSAAERDTWAAHLASQKGTPFLHV